MRARSLFSQGLPSHAQWLLAAAAEADRDGDTPDAWRGEVGDPGGRLPPSDLTRLVGVKVPQTGWPVGVRVRR
jgi:hypothetical protein